MNKVSNVLRESNSSESVPGKSIFQESGWNEIKIIPEEKRESLLCGTGIKEQIDKSYLMNIKNFCASKDAINRVTGNPQIRRKYFQIPYVIRDRDSERIENDQKQ